MTTIIAINFVLAATVLCAIVTLIATGIVTARSDRGITLVRRRRSARGLARGVVLAA